MRAPLPLRPEPRQAGPAHRRDRRCPVSRGRYHEHAAHRGALGGAPARRGCCAMKLRFLGTGTSFGVPVVGCTCRACTSGDARDRRTRHGALLHYDDGRNLLIDTPPELRLQLLAGDVRRIDAVWFTHGHADHTHGIDDLRVFSDRADRKLPVYADHEHAASLRAKFQYIFDDTYLPVGGPKVNLDLRTFGPFDRVPILDRELVALPLPHGDTTVYGFRIGSLGYVTDAKELSADVRRELAGIRVLVLNALWFGRPHPTHFNVEEAVAMAEALGAEITYLTHLTHRVTYAELIERLPPGVRPAHDGLVVDLPQES